MRPDFLPTAATRAVMHYLSPTMQISQPLEPSIEPPRRSSLIFDLDRSILSRMAVWSSRWISVRRSPIFRDWQLPAPRSQCSCFERIERQIICFLQSGRLLWFQQAGCAHWQLSLRSLVRPSLERVQMIHLEGSSCQGLTPFR